MAESPRVERYGVKLQTEDGDDVARAAEKLAIVGYTLLDAGYNASERQDIAEAFDRLRHDREMKFGRAALEAIDEHNTIRAPLVSSDAMMRLAQNERVLRLCETMLGNAFILNQQNGIINPPMARYNQAAWHRDLPYQHFVVSRPIALNALYCVDTFSIENGCTHVIPGSHKYEAFPADRVVSELATGVEAPAGTFLVLDAMTFHTGSRNTSQNPRRAVNHLYTLPFVKQQISFQAILAGRELSPRTRLLLGMSDEQSPSIEAYYERRLSKAKT